MAREVTVTFDDGQTAVYRNVPDTVTPEEVTARAQGEYAGKTITEINGGKKKTTADINQGVLAETGRVLDKTIRGGATALPGFLGDAALQKFGLKPLENWMWEKFGGVKREDDGPKFGDVTKTLQTAGGLLPELSKPQTSAGQAIGNIGESIVSTALGGGAQNLTQRMGIGAGSGVGGEVGARLTDDSPVGRLIGALLGGGVTAAAQARQPNARDLIQQSTSEMRDSDWQKAKVLEALLDKGKLPHLKSQILGPRSTLDDVVTTASGQPGAKPKFAVMNDVQKRADELISEKALNNLMPGMKDRTGELDDIQGVATGVIGKLREKSNQEFVKAMPKADLEYKPAQVQQMYDQIVNLAKSSKYGETSDQGKALLAFAAKLKVANPADPMADGFVTNAHQINNLIKGDNLRQLGEQGLKGLPDKDIKRIIQAGTPEFDAARRAKQVIVEGEVNPAKKSMLGQIADMGGGIKPDKVTARESVIDLVFNKGLKPQEIRQLGDQIGGDALGSLLREHISKTMQKTWSSDLARAEVKVNDPNRLADAIAGQNWKRQNINAALEVVAKSNGQNPAEVQKGFYQLMRAFETYKDAKLAPGISPTAANNVASKNTAATVVAPGRSFFNYFQGKASDKTYREISEIVLSKDGLKQLEALAKSPKPERARALALGVLSQASAAMDEAPTEGN